MSATSTITTERTHIVRERQFSLDGGDEAILRAAAHLRREGVTGTLMMDIANGGVCSIRFREQQQVNFSENNHK